MKQQWQRNTGTIGAGVVLIFTLSALRREILLWITTLAASYSMISFTCIGSEKLGRTSPIDTCIDLVQLLHFFKALTRIFISFGLNIKTISSVAKVCSCPILNTNQLKINFIEYWPESMVKLDKAQNALKF